MDTEIKNKIILALDYSNLDDAMVVLNEVKDYVGIAKIGLQLFSANGPKAVEVIKQQGYEIFLDLKLYDIPTTIMKTLKVISSLDVLFTTIHLGRNPQALSIISSEFEQLNPRLKILGVTVLTSEPAEKELIIDLVNQGKLLNLSGFVLSASDLPFVKKYLGALEAICPGIRLDEYKDDQVRVATPSQAIKAGATRIVIGRPITQAIDPRQAARKIFDSVKQALT